jgi:fatty-acyl-CoA synthase
MVPRMIDRVTALAGRIGDELFYLRVCYQAGLIQLDPPRRAVEVARTIRRQGLMGGGISVAALRHGDRVAVIDERGSLTYSELDVRSNALANALIARGL